MGFGDSRPSAAHVENSGNTGVMIQRGHDRRAARRRHVHPLESCDVCVTRRATKRSGSHPRWRRGFQITSGPLTN